MKGHNWYGLCKKCGKSHGKPPLLGTHASAETRLKQSKVRKGRKLTPEWKRNIRLAIVNSEKYYYAMYLCGEAKRGKKLPPSHVLNITLGIRKYFRNRTKETVRKLHNLPKTAEFIPARVYDHFFARKILIEGHECSGLIVQSSLPIQPEWIENNRNDNAQLIELSDTIRELQKEQQ